MSPSPLQQIATYIQRQQVASAVAYSSTPEGQKHEEASDGPGPSQVALNEEESEGEGEQMQVGTEELYQQVCVCVCTLHSMSPLSGSRIHFTCICVMRMCPTAPTQEETAPVEKKNRSCVIS